MMLSSGKFTFLAPAKKINIQYTIYELPSFQKYTVLNNDYYMIRSGYSIYFILIILAGIPATTQLSGKSLLTTAFAPIVTLLPI